ncbi:MerR family transcriptional regulator [Actinocatenispora thailandica]|uniref:MerR family transcriptional regulator n=1 Tax=Actinocatenispora thailandica TaxID=227318 RepID=A0A7R7I0A6_9ACTN|nr:MerR family transcriptional regulator [Actinocatenispora thailandica]BCJ38314.1 MerR family transcriptional regulator [Actinocatenispora thailandica]
MLIGEVARRVGVSKDTVRLYERLGLVRGSRLPNGYRDFPAEAVTWLGYVRTAQALGFTLAEISRHADTLSPAPSDAPAVSELVAAKLRLIDARIAELAALRAELAGRVGTDCPMRPIPRPPGGSARSGGPACPTA